jgi:hypothetical protein
MRAIQYTGYGGGAASLKVNSVTSFHVQVLFRVADYFG